MVVSQSFISSSIWAQITSAYYILLWLIKMLIDKSKLSQFQERSTSLNRSPFWYLSHSQHNPSSEIHINSLLSRSVNDGHFVHYQSRCTCFVQVLSFWDLSGYLTSLPTPTTYLQGKITVSWLRHFPESRFLCTWILYFTYLSQSPNFFLCSHKTFDCCFSSVSSRSGWLFLQFLFLSSSPLQSCSVQLFVLTTKYLHT